MTGHRLTVFRHRKSLLYILASGLAMALDWLFLFESYQKIGVGLGTLINYYGSVIAIALSPFLFQEQLSRYKAAALFIALLGIFLISGQAAIFGITHRVCSVPECPLWPIPQW